MRRLLGMTTGVALTLLCTAGAAHAQLLGSVVHNGSMGPGVRVGGDFTRGVNEESGKTNYFGGRIMVGLPLLSVWGGIGVITTGDTETTFGGGVAAKLIKGPLVPVEVTLQGGIGYQSENGDNTLNIPVGVAVMIDVPSPAVSVKPWIMPRLNLRRMDPDVGESQTEVGFGVSGGLIVNVPNGMGAHATLDWMTIDAGSVTTKPLLLNVGVHYTISVPGLGIL